MPLRNMPSLPQQTGWSNKQGGTTCFDDFVWRSNCAGVPPLLKVILPGWRWWRRRLEWGRYFQCNGWRGAPIFPSRSSRFSSGCKPAGWCLVGLIAICHVYSGQGMPRRIGSHQEMSHLTHSNAITISAPLRTVTPKGPKTSTNKSTTARSISERARLSARAMARGIRLPYCRTITQFMQDADIPRMIQRFPERGAPIDALGCNLPDNIVRREQANQSAGRAF
jgi:hypothetical protein